MNPTTVVVTDCTGDSCDFTSAGTWTALIIAAGLIVLGAALVYFAVRLTRARYDDEDVDVDDIIDYGPGAVLSLTGAMSVAGGIITAAVAYVAMLVNGWASLWTLGVVVAAGVYGAVRLERRVAARRKAN